MWCNLIVPNYISWIPWQRQRGRGAKQGLLMMSNPQKKGGQRKKNMGAQLWAKVRTGRKESLHILREHFDAAALCLNVDHTDSGGTSLAQGKEMCSAVYCLAGKYTGYSVITLAHGWEYKWRSSSISVLVHPLLAEWERGQLRPLAPWVLIL